MKRVLIKKMTDPKRRIKSLSITQSKADKECRTHIRKGFLYHVSKADEQNPVTKRPQVYIKKVIDRDKKVETFNFQVKGRFYLMHARTLVKVCYHHTLDVQIFWKKNFSPKKSAVLTK